MSVSMHSEPLFEGFLDHSSAPIKRILDAAERCLWRSGYGGMSIRDVADEAGVSKSLLHYHFKSKEHLLLEVQIAVYNRMAAHVTAAVQDVTPGTNAALHALEAVFDALRSIGELPVLAELQARSLTNPKLRAHALRLREHIGDLVVGTLQRVLGPELARFPIPSQPFADIILAALMGLGLQAGIDDTPDRVEAAFAGLKRIAALALAQPTQED